VRLTVSAVEVPKATQISISLLNASRLYNGRVVTLCCYAAKTAANFTVGLTNVHPLMNNPEMGNYNVCGQYPGLVPQGATVKLQCENTDLQPARYVIVQFPTADRLRFCELEVYATEGWAAHYSNTHRFFEEPKFSSKVMAIGPPLRIISK